MGSDDLWDRNLELAMERAVLEIDQARLAKAIEDEDIDVEYYKYFGHQFQIDLNSAEAQKIEEEEGIHGYALELTLLTRAIEERACQIEQENAAADARQNKQARPEAKPTEKPKTKVAPTMPKPPVRVSVATAPAVQENPLGQLFKFALKFFGATCLVIAVLWILLVAISSCSTSSRTATSPSTSKSAASTSTTRPSTTNSNPARTTTTPSNGNSSNDEDAYNAWLEDNAIEDGEYDFDVEGGDWESVDPPDRNSASGYKPEWDKYYKEDFPEVDF